MKRFYSRQLSAVVADAECGCGHLESEHGSQLKRTGTLQCRIPDGGSCCDKTCECLQFTWRRWVSEEEYARRTNKRAHKSA